LGADGEPTKGWGFDGGPKTVSNTTGHWAPQHNNPTKNTKKKLKKKTHPGNWLILYRKRGAKGSPGGLEYVKIQKQNFGQSYAKPRKGGKKPASSGEFCPNENGTGGSRNKTRQVKRGLKAQDMEKRLAPQKTRKKQSNEGQKVPKGRKKGQ